MNYDEMARLLAEMRGVTDQKSNAIDQLIESQSQPVNRGVRAQGQTWGGVFKDPTDPQREGFLMAGLSLLGSSDNDNLSQRIGQAIGQGVGAIREVREMESERGMAGQKLELQKLGIQQEGLKGQFDATSGLAQLRMKREAELNEQTRHNENKSLKQQQIDIASMSDIEKMEVFASELEADGQGDAAERVRDVIRKRGQFAPSRPGSSITLPDGTVVDMDGGASNGMGNPKKLGNEISKQDALQVGESRVKARQAGRLIHQAQKVEQALLDGVNTGTVQPAIMTLRGLYKELTDLVPGDSEFAQTNAEELNRQELVVAVGNEWGARMLELFGGSDTQKELEVALTTQVGLGFDEKTNKDRIQDKIIAGKILARRPDFESEWLTRNQSLSSPDKETGKGFSESWMDYQMQEYRGVKRQIDLGEKFKDESTDELIKRLNSGTLK